MRAAWTAFTKTGDPGWPRYDSQRRLVQIFDSATKVAVYPEDVSRRIWQNHKFVPLPLLDKVNDKDSPN
jgi:para-nitrobenzyl esterase